MEQPVVLTRHLPGLFVICLHPHKYRRPDKRGDHRWLCPRPDLVGGGGAFTE